jgi:trans-aconitate methyltransferase
MFEKNWFETWYSKEDPWGYRSTSDDATRKLEILQTLQLYAPFTRALDIGCGEGFITEDLPAASIDGLEISDKAAARLSPKVRRVLVPDGHYDLVITTGTLYKEYDHAQIASWISTSASRLVLVCGIRDWLLPYSFGKVLQTKEFSYRESLHQKLTLYEVSS